jgi:hypothetical protein
LRGLLIELRSCDDASASGHAALRRDSAAAELLDNAPRWATPPGADAATQLDASRPAGKEFAVKKIIRQRFATIKRAAVVLAALPAVTAASFALHSPAAHLSARATGGTIVRTAVAQTFAPQQSRATSTTSYALGTGPGYQYLTPRLIGETPRGLHVWVLSGSHHRAAIAHYTAATVHTLRTYGLHVYWEGYGRPNQVEGIVTVAESQDGCGSKPGIVGMTWTYLGSIGNGDSYNTHARVALCPTLFSQYGSWALAATVHHELGHAMGLGHTNYVFHGSYQAMNASIHSGVLRYETGDINGLRWLAANNGRVRAEMAPVGRLEHSTWNPDGTINFTGWAFLRYAKSAGVNITLTDNGRVISRSITDILRADVNRLHDPGLHLHGFSLNVPAESGTHNYCVTATSTLNNVTTQLGCTTWNR